MDGDTTQTDKISIIDEALASEPIRNTFRLGWEFIKVNQSFTITAMIIFITLNIFTTITSLSLIFMMFSSIFMTIIQIHVGRTLYHSRDIKSYIDKISKSNLNQILTENILTGVGVYLGWVVLLLLSFILLEFFGKSLYIINRIDVFNISISIIAILLLYIQPLVQANVIMANGFKNGFKAVFTIFSIKLWRLSFNSSYFKYISIFWIVLFLSIVILVFLIGIITKLIGLKIIGSILMLVLMYLFTIIIAIASMMAKGVLKF